MKQILITLFCCLLTLAAYAQGGKPLTLKDVVTGTFRVERTSTESSPSPATASTTRR